jgi:predicted metalloprotease
MGTRSRKGQFRRSSPASGRSASPAFYCPADKVVYLAPTFFDEFQQMAKWFRGQG